MVVICAVSLPAANASAAEPADDWAPLTASVGLQMWQPVYVSETADRSSADPSIKPTIGGVLKLNYLLTENIGAHLRGTYGVHSTTVPNRNASGQAWAVGLGLDVYHHLGQAVLWSNTMGLAAGQSKIAFEGVGGPDVTSIGAYFITTLDVTLFGPVGVWMDWGCQVVGPSMAKAAGSDISVWHINPLGAGGMRVSF